MGEKYIKKIVNLTITREEWQSSTSSGEEASFLVKGEVKNTGLSEIKNAIIIAAIVHARKNTTYQTFSKKLTIFKAADYSILPPLKPGNTHPFEIAINFPPFKSLLFGRWSLRSLEDKLLNGVYKQKVYTLFDTNVLDEKTQEWFREELLENLKLVLPKWTPMRNQNKALTGYTCTGRIKNIGAREIKHFNIQGTFINQYGEPLKVTVGDDEYLIQGNYTIDNLMPHSQAEFELACQLPSLEILEENDLSPDLIEKRVKNGELKPRITTAYVNNLPQKQIYRDVDQAPTIIEEETGTKKIEKIEEEWTFDDDHDEYIVAGSIKNSGTRDVENVYIIASIVEEESNQPISWESATETAKTLVIDKLSYLKAGDEYAYALRVRVPSGKLFGKMKWSAKNIPDGINNGELLQGVDLYYTKEDVHGEGMKRLSFGNSYFLLKNYRGCLREYKEGMKLIPDEKRFFLNSSLCYYKLNDMQKALELCRGALKLDARYVKALYLTGLIYHSMKNYDEALAWYMKAYEMEKNNVRIVYNIGCVHISQERVEEGVTWFRKAFILDKRQVMNQMVKDPELRPIRENKHFSDFLNEIRREAYAH